MGHKRTFSQKSEGTLGTLEVGVRRPPPCKLLAPLKAIQGPSTSTLQSFDLHKYVGKHKKTLNCQAYKTFSRNEKTLEVGVRRPSPCKRLASLNAIQGPTKSNNSWGQQKLTLTPMEKSYYWNQCFDKGRLKNFVLWFLRNNGEHKTIQLVEELKNLGFQYATKAGISLGIEDLKIPLKKTSLLFLAEKETAVTIKQYKRGDITGVERFQRLINTWHQTSEQLKQEVIDNFEATDILNPVYMMAFSGARGNISQVRQLVGMRGLMSNPQGQIIDFPIRSNFREGLTLTEYIISSYGARKGIVDTALRTANAGYLTRRLVDVAQHVIISNFDCGTRRGIFLKDMKEGNKTILSLSTRLVGRVCATDIYTNTGIDSQSEGQKTQIGYLSNNSSSLKTPHKIAKRNDEISLELSYEISKVTKKVFVRSALTCETKKLVCQLCYGWSLAQGNLVSIGEAIGVIAAQSIGEPGTQLTMRTFHTGGVFSGDLSDLIKMPFKGIILYASPIAGTLIRTPEGKIAFLTKSEGCFTISKISELIEKEMWNTLNFSQQEGKALSQRSLTFAFQQFQSKNNLFSQTAMQTKKYKIPPYTILYARNGEILKEKEIVAQITTINLQKTATDTAEITIQSEMEGELHINYLDLKENKVGPKLTKKEKEKKVFRNNTSNKKRSFFLKENTFNNVHSQRSLEPFGSNIENKESTNLMSTVFEAWKWGNAWILSGNIYHAGKPAKFFPKIGDFLKEKSVITGPHALHSTSIVSGNLKLGLSKKGQPKYALPILLKNSLSTNGCNSQRSLASGPTFKKFNKNHVFDEKTLASNAKQDLALNNTKKENEPIVKNEFLSFSLNKISYKKFGYFVKLNDFSSYKSAFADPRFPLNTKLNFSLKNKKTKCSNTFLNVQKLSIKNEFLTTKDPIFIIPPNLQVLLNKSFKPLYPSNWQPKFNFVLQWFPTRFQTKTAGFFVIENIKDVKNRKLYKLLPKSSKPSTGKATNLFQNLLPTYNQVKKNQNLALKKQSLHGLNESLTSEKYSMQSRALHNKCCSATLRNEKLLCLNKHKKLLNLQPAFFNSYYFQSNQNENQQKKRIAFLNEGQRTLTDSLASQAINQNGKFENRKIQKISRILWIPDCLNNSKKHVSISQHSLEPCIPALGLQTSALPTVHSMETVEQVKQSLRKSGTRRKCLFQKTQYKTEGPTTGTNLKSFCYFFSSTLLGTNKVGQSPVFKQKTQSFVNHSLQEDNQVLNFNNNLQNNNGWYYFIFDDLKTSSTLFQTNKETQNQENNYSSNNSEGFIGGGTLGTLTQTNSFPFYPGQAILSDLRVDNHIVNVSLLDLDKNKEQGYFRNADEPVDFSFFSMNNLNFEFWLDNPKCRYQNTNLDCNFINKHQKRCVKKRKKSLVVSIQNLPSHYSNGNNLGGKKTTTKGEHQKNKVYRSTTSNSNSNKKRNSLLKAFFIQKVEEYPLYLKNTKDFLNLKTEIYESSNSSNNPLNGLSQRSLEPCKLHKGPSGPYQAIQGRKTFALNNTFYKKSLISNVVKRPKLQNTSLEYPFYKVKTGNQKLSLYALLYNRKVAPLGFSLGMTKKSLPLLIEKNNGYFWGPKKTNKEIKTFHFFQKVEVFSSQRQLSPNLKLGKDFFYKSTFLIKKDLRSQKGQGQFLNMGEGAKVTNMKKHVQWEFLNNKKYLKRKKTKQILFNKSFLSLKLVHDFKSAQLNKQSISPQLFSKYPNVDIQILGEFSIPISQNKQLLLFKDSMYQNFCNKSSAFHRSEFVPNPQNLFTFWITVPSNDTRNVLRTNTSNKKGGSFLIRNTDSKKENLSGLGPSIAFSKAKSLQGFDKSTLFMQSSLCNGLFDYPFKEYIFDFCPSQRSLEPSKLLATLKAIQGPTTFGVTKLNNSNQPTITNWQNNEKKELNNFSVGFSYGKKIPNRILSVLGPFQAFSKAKSLQGGGTLGTLMSKNQNSMVSSTLWDLVISRQSLQKLPVPCFNSSLTYSLDSLFSKKNTASAVKFYGNDQNIVSPLVPFAKTFSYSPFEGEILQINSPYSLQMDNMKRDSLSSNFSYPSQSKCVEAKLSMQSSALQKKTSLFLKTKLSSEKMSNFDQKEQNTSLIIQKKDIISFYFIKKKHLMAQRDLVMQSSDLHNSDVDILSHSKKKNQETNFPNFYIIKDMLVPMSTEIANENSISNKSNSNSSQSDEFSNQKNHSNSQNQTKEEQKINNELQLFKIPHFFGGFPNFKAGYSFQKKNKNKKSLTVNQTIETKFFIGDFIVMGDTIYSLKKEKKFSSWEKNNDNKQNVNPFAVTKSGQIIHIGQEKITIRKGQPLFISPKAILHKFNGDFIESQSPVITLSYQRLKTGDIVQGIPKIEQFFEARTTKRGRLFRDSLPNLLNALFRRYLQKLPLEKAVRQSFYKIQQIIVDGVLRVYRSQGVTIADKHLEIIVKQMTSKVRIIEGGQTGFFPGEVVDLDFVEQVNDLLMKKIQYEPLVLGITKSSLEVDSFLSAASFQQTTRVLSQAAISRKKDFLKGLKENVILGNLIPAGTGYLVYLDDIYKQKN
jgi:DNA-directed RNA polymerase beta' subunit